MEVITQIRINASRVAIWDVFARFEDYPKWNTFIRSITGKVQQGKVIEVVLQQPDMNPMNMKPTVLVFEKNRELRWVGHLGFSGLFDGEHVFQFEDNEDGTTTFVQKEIFRGILVPLFRKMLNTKTRQGFENMNRELKELVEKI